MRFALWKRSVVGHGLGRIVSWRGTRTVCGDWFAVARSENRRRNSPGMLSPTPACLCRSTWDREDRLWRDTFGRLDGEHK